MLEGLSYQKSSSKYTSSSQDTDTVVAGTRINEQKRELGNRLTYYENFIYSTAGTDDQSTKVRLINPMEGQLGFSMENG